MSYIARGLRSPMTRIQSAAKLPGSLLRVVHYQERAGALTENWVHNQITGIDSHVVGLYAHVRKDDNATSFPNLRCVEADLHGVSRLADRIGCRFVHRSPHLLLWLRRDRANIVHAHFGPAGNDMWPFTRLLGIPLVTSFYGCDAYQLPYRTSCPTGYYRRLFRFGHRFLVEGSAMRRKLIELGCPADKVVIHHIGINVAQTIFRPRRPEGSIRLLVCGRFIEKKGIPFALEAVQRVRQATGRDVRLTVVGDSDGQGSMTPEKGKILAAVRQHNLDGIVSFVGFVSRHQLPETLHNHHILVVPSIHAADGDAEGGFPVIITEALASGMPVVAFDHCDIREIVKDGECGFLAPEGEVAALARCLGRMVEHPEIWPELGRAGRAHVEANYDIAKLNDRLVDLYRGLLKNDG